MLGLAMETMSGRPVGLNQKSTCRKNQHNEASTPAGNRNSGADLWCSRQQLAKRRLICSRPSLRNQARLRLGLYEIAKVKEPE